METVPFNPLSISFNSLIRDKKKKKRWVSNDFLGIEIGHESGVSECFYRSEMPVPSMVSQWFLGIDSNKGCHSVVLAG